jgi:hypothetical protein
MTPDPVVCTGHQELRDIVIETRRDVKYIRESLDQIQGCLHDHDARIRVVEIKGSEKAETALEAVNDLIPRVAALEKDCYSETAVQNAKGHWIDTTWARVGMLIGAALGIAAFIRELF